MTRLCVFPHLRQRFGADTSQWTEHHLPLTALNTNDALETFSASPSRDRQLPATLASSSVETISVFTRPILPELETRISDAGVEALQYPFRQWMEREGQLELFVDNKSSAQECWDLQVRHFLRRPRLIDTYLAAVRDWDNTAAH
jgi:hypothetical protein